jgi:hypothetical protein
MDLKRSYRQQAVLRHGLPLKVTCDGPARIVAALDFADRETGWWIVRHYGNGGDPGSEAFTPRPASVPAAGSVTVHLHFKPWALRMAREFRRIRMWHVLYVEDAKGRFRGTHADNPYSTLVR